MTNTRDLTLAEMLRTGHVKRWNIVRVAREQTIAEHMYRVWLITNEFCSAIGCSDGERLEVQFLALTHDIPEVMTGDIPTPSKDMIRSICKSYHPGAANVINELDSRVCPELSELWSGLSSKAHKIVRLADLFEAVVFLRVEGIGARAKEIEAILYKELKQKTLEFGPVEGPALHAVMESTIRAV